MNVADLSVAANHILPPVRQPLVEAEQVLLTLVGEVVEAQRQRREHGDEAENQPPQEKAGHAHMMLIRPRVAKSTHA